MNISPNTESGSSYVWLNNDEAVTERFGALLAGVKTKKAFGDEWFKRVAARVEDERKDLAKVIITSLIPTGYLALALMNLNPQVPSWFGTATAHVFELALLATCFLGLYGAVIAISRAQSYRLMRIWSERTHGADANGTYLSAYYSPLFAWPKMIDPPVELATPTAGSRAASLLASACVGGTVSFIAIATLCIQIWAISHVFALPGRFAMASAILATAMTIVNFLMLYPLFGVRRPYNPTSADYKPPRINVLPPEP